MKTEFYNKNGELTKYSFCCGYGEVKKKQKNSKSLFFEHNAYFVNSIVNNEIQNFTFDKNELTKARQKYRSIKL